MEAIRKYPHVVIGSLDIDLCLIYMNERACEDPLQQHLFGPCIILRKIGHKFDNAAFADVFAEQIFNDLGDDTVREPKRDPLVDRPGAKAMPKQATLKLTNPWREIVMATAWAMAPGPDIFCNCLSAPVLGEGQGNDGMLS
jgi:hypothetical protein